MAVRILSVIAGLGVVGIVYLFASKVFNSKVALTSAVIIALSPFQIHYAQEIRMYVFMCLWLLLATYSYWRASQANDLKWWFLFASFAALAQYSHNLSAFYLVALALWPMITKNWRILKSTILAGLLALLLYTPSLIHLPAQFSKVSQAYWIEKPGLYRIFTLFLVFVTNLPSPDSWLVIGLFISLCIVVVALLQTIHATQRKQADSQTGLWMLYLAFAPPILLFLFSQWKSVYLERALLPSGAIFCIWLAWTFTETQLSKPIQFVTAILLLLGFGIGIDQHIPYGPYQALMDNLHSKEQAGDVIIHSSKLSMLPSVYFDQNILQTYVADPSGSNVDTLAPSTQQVLRLIAQPDIETAAGDAKRIWFIIFDQSNQEYIRAGNSMHHQLAWLKTHYSQVSVQS